MSTIMQSTIANGLKATLEEVITDPSDGYERDAVYTRYMQQMPMSDAWEDDLEVGGPGLASEKGEGTEISTGTIREGYITRYIARTYAIKLIVTEEALEDSKYPRIIDAAKRCKRAMYKTVDTDCANIFVRGWNTSYVGGDALPLFSASHTLPDSGTFSNTMSTPMSPSRAAVIIATSAMAKMPGHDGLVEGVSPKTVVCPTEQWAVWEGLLRSRFAPEPGAFNEINVVNQSLDMDVVPIKYWGNTTTNWAILSDCDYKINLRWRRKPRSKTWVEESQELMNYAISARWSRGWSDPRAAYGVQA